MFSPKQTKYKTLQKNLILGSTLRGTTLIFGNYGLKATNSGRIRANQIAACYKLLKRKVKNIGQFWVRIFAHKPVTQKSKKSRMGKGKGKLHYWMCDIKKNKILFEIQTNSDMLAKKILKEVGMKLPLATQIIIISK